MGRFLWLNLGMLVPCLVVGCNEPEARDFQKIAEEKREADAAELARTRRPTSSTGSVTPYNSLMKARQTMKVKLIERQLQAMADFEARKKPRGGDGTIVDVADPDLVKNVVSANVAIKSAPNEPKLKDALKKAEQLIERYLRQQDDLGSELRALKKAYRNSI